MKQIPLSEAAARLSEYGHGETGIGPVFGGERFLELTGRAKRGPVHFEAFLTFSKE